MLGLYDYYFLEVIDLTNLSGGYPRAVISKKSYGNQPTFTASVS